MHIRIRKGTGGFYLFDVFSTSLLLMGTLCFTASEHIYLFLAIIFVDWVKIGLQMLKQNNKLYLSLYGIWLIVFNIILFFYGIVTPYGGYSLPYHACLVLSQFALYFSMKQNQNDIIKYFKDFSVCTILICSIYLCIAESARFYSLIPQIIAGTSWYRFGNNSDVNPNAIAIYFGIMSFAVVYYLFTQKLTLFHKLVYVGLIVLCIIVIILTGSKKGIILIVGEILTTVYIVFSRGTKIRKKLRVIILAIVLLLVGFYLLVNVPFIYNLVGHRIGDMFYQLGFANTYIKSSNLVGNSTILRSEMLKLALKMIIQKPIIGWGWNAFTVLSGYNLFTHNNYTELLVSMGVIGLIAFYWFHIHLFFRLIHTVKLTQVKFAISLLVIIMMLDMAMITIYDSVIEYLVVCISYIIYMNIVKEQRGEVTHGRTYKFQSKT